MDEISESLRDLYWYIPLIVMAVNWYIGKKLINIHKDIKHLKIAAGVYGITKESDPDED